MHMGVALWRPVAAGKVLRRLAAAAATSVREAKPAGCTQGGSGFSNL